MLFFYVDHRSEINNYTIQCTVHGTSNTFVCNMGILDVRTHQQSVAQGQIFMIVVVVKADHVRLPNCHHGRPITLADCVAVHSVEHPQPTHGYRVVPLKVVGWEVLLGAALAFPVSCSIRFVRLCSN